LIFDAHRVLGHKKLPELTQRALSAAHNKLAAVILEPRVRSAAWATVRRDLEAMHASMFAYESYLVEQNNVQSARHLSGQPVRPPTIGLAGDTCGSSPTTPFAYLTLRDALLLLDLYEAVDLSNFAPGLPSKSYSFIVNVQLPFLFHVVRRAYGNNKGTRSFAFHVEPDSATNSTRILQESVRITSALPAHHTREQRRQVAEAVSGAGGTQSSTVLALYQVLTGDESDMPTKKEVLDDLTRAIDERVPMEHVAMTVQDNERHRGGKFTDFFRVAKGILLNEAAVDDRRHGHQLYQTVVNSIKDLIWQVKDNCAADGLDESAMPPEYWIRLQFCPTNPFAKTSARCPGLLGVS
jgi:hypothetical protein